MWMAEAKAKIDIPLHDAKLETVWWGRASKDDVAKYGDAVISAGRLVTITKGLNEKYALWCGHGLYDLPEEYVDESTISIKAL